MKASFLFPTSNNQRLLNGSIRKSIKAPLMILLISLLLTTVARDTGLACAKTEDTSHHVAETLLDLLKVSCEEVNALFLSISNCSDTTDDLVEALAEAKTLHEEAKTYFEAGEYDQAIDRATKAMNLYGKVASKIYEIQRKNEEPNEDEEAEETVEPVELYSYYEKALDRLKRFKEITSELESQGVEVSETLALIIETESSLADMKEKLVHGDFEKAVSMRKVVEDALGEVEGGLQSQGHEKRKEKAERFIDQTRQRVQHLETKYDEVLGKHDVSDDDTRGIHEELQEILYELEEADTAIDEDELDEAIEHIKYTVKELKDVGKDQEGLEDGLAENLNNLNDQDFILKTYLDRIRKLEGLGIDTVELDDLLEEIERLLVDANEKINEGKNEDAENIIDDSDDLLDELDDLIYKLQEEEEKTSEEKIDDKETEEVTDDEEGTNDNKAEVDETKKDEDNEKLDEDPPEANEGDEVGEKETDDKDEGGGSEEAEDDGEEENEEPDGSRRNKEERDYFKVWLEKIKERTVKYGESTDTHKKERMDTADLVKLFKKIHSPSKRIKESEDIEEFSASMEELEDIDDVDEGKKAEEPEDDEKIGDDEIEEEAEEPEDDEKIRDDKPDKKSSKIEEKTAEDDDDEEETDEAELDEPSHGRGNGNHIPPKEMNKNKSRRN